MRSAFASSRALEARLSLSLASSRAFAARAPRFFVLFKCLHSPGLRLLGFKPQSPQPQPSPCAKQHSLPWHSSAPDEHETDFHSI
ncbi:hypothetical protein HanRHA438_Chr01g0043321 [Helianthus annuus]|nr:hypothetical protein HanRHA438_Chr01g0043321 [Helianthus annuus]